MANAVLESLRAERAEQIAAMEAVLSQVEGRDLVEAERNLLDRARVRIGELDAQIEPLEAFEALAQQHRDTVNALPAPANPRPTVSAPATTRQRVDMAAENPRGHGYRSPGAFLVDYLRGNGLFERGVRDEAAAARLYQARADQTTGDTPGLLPQLIVGQVVSLIDQNRPLIQSLGGVRGLSGIPGTTFERPKITQHVTVGVQTAEKTSLPSQKMTIAAVPFAKKTYGGTVDISRQDIDWSSPAAWDILIRDLADVYAIQTETVVAADFATNATGIKPPALPAAPVLADWTKGLYTAAMHSYSAGKRMPTRLWCSLDVWAALGSLVDQARVVLPPDATNGVDAPLDTFDIGSSSLASFRGDVLGLPRIVVPLFPAKTCIVGPDSLYEVYEEVIGLLSVIEPSILGVQVAYGGYLAFGTMAGTAYVPLDLSAVTSLPTALDADELAAQEAAETEQRQEEHRTNRRRAAAAAPPPEPPSE
jgi:HK97 family phage major capsid protein